MKKLMMALMLMPMVTLATTSVGLGFWTVTKYNLTEDVADASLEHIAEYAEAGIANMSIRDGDPVTQVHETLAFMQDLPPYRDAHFRNEMTNYPGTRSNYFVVEATGAINIPETGNWTFACGADDVFSVTISGNGLLKEFHSSSSGMINTDLEIINIPVAGVYSVRVLQVNSFSESALEFSVARGSYSSFDSAAFKLVGDPASDVTLVASSIPVVPTDGLVAYYPFNGNANDASGNKNNGVVHGATLITDRFGHVNSAYYFDGSAYIEAPHSETLATVTSSMTLMTWFRMDSSIENEWTPFVCKGTSSRQFSLVLHKVGSQLKLFVNDWVGAGDGTTLEVPISLGTINPEEWYNFAISYDGSELRAYINGVLNGAVAVVGNFTPCNGALFIGKDPPGVVEYFGRGALDDVRIYNRALSAEEIKALYEGTAEAKEVNNVVAEPQNGKVTLTYEIVGNMAVGAPAGTVPALVITARDTVTSKAVTSVTSALSGDTDCAEGEHQVVWDMAKQGVSVNGSKVVFTVSYVCESPYCVIDLSAGANASSYPVSYLDDVPAGGWTDEYKTSKLVLKKIAPGSFTVDEVDYDVGDEPFVVDTHEVSITKPFFMGVFEVTQKQYELVTGQNPSRFKGDMRPVERVTWDEIRGQVGTHNWPKVKTVDGNSFVGRLRARSGIAADLPTLAQGEYAFRAADGEIADRSAYGRIPDNVDDGKGGYGEHTAVGSYAPNSWGIYDMYGNVSEWTLDWEWYVSGDVSDPVGPNSSADESKIMCGSSWHENIDGYWDGSGTVRTSDRSSDLGFRIAASIPEGVVSGRTICSGDSEPVETAPVYTFFTGYKMTVNVKLKGYTAKGLPSGLSYDSKKGTVSGAAKKATAASGVAVTFTKKGKPAVKVIVVVRKEVLSAGCEDLDGVTFAAGMRRSGTIPLQLSTESGVKSVAVTGLPAGMKFDAKKRVITGFPTKGGDYTVTIKLTGKTGVSKTVKLTVHVDALPTFATGTFHGFAATEAGKTLGAFTLTAASSGALTAKVVGANKTYSFSKSGWDSAEGGVYVSELATKAGDRLVLRVDSTASWDANQATGTLTPAAGDAAAVSAQRRAFNKTWRFVATGDAQLGWKLAYAAPSETANLTVSVGADGVTTLAGKLGTYAVSASGYANVGTFKAGALIADFAPIVTVGKGKTAKKLQFSVFTNLWFDIANAPDGDVGSAYIEQ